MPWSPLDGVYLADVAPPMWVHPVFRFEDLAHCQVAPFTPPSGSLRHRTDGETRRWEKLIVPASSTLRTVAVIVCSVVIARSPVPPVAVTVTMYSLFPAPLTGSALATSAALS